MADDRDAPRRTECCCTPEDQARVHVHRSKPDSEELAVYAKALGHPARIQILRVLLAREKCVCGEIVDALPLAQSTVSQHLKILREAGLICGQVEGTRVCYCASRETLDRVGVLLGALLLS